MKQHSNQHRPLTERRVLASLYRAAELGDAPADELGWVFQTNGAADRLQQLAALNDTWSAERNAPAEQPAEAEHLATVVPFGRKVRA